VFASYAHFSVSDGGLLVYSGPAPVQMQWVDRLGNVLGSFGEPGFLMAPRQSPDGRKVAVTQGTALLITDIARGVTSRIGRTDGQNVSWSPDGQKIAASRGGAITVLNAESGEEISVTDPARNFVAGWTPDGKSLVYVQRSSGTKHPLWIVPVGSTAGRRWLLEADYDQMQASISPDGHWIAYSGYEGGRAEVYVARFETPLRRERVQISAGGGNFPQWRRDGKELFYLARDGTLMAVAVKKAAAGLEFEAPRRLFPLAATYVSSYAYDASPDGQKFLVLAPFRRRPHEPITVVVNWPALMR
jgi:Tol biopolymer transport system component